MIARNPARNALSIWLFLLFASYATAAQTNLLGPSGSGHFGKNAQVLPNGNIVVVDPDFTNNGVAQVGAVYMYSAATLELISQLTGSSAGDQVGSGGIVILPDTNYVVLSPSWKNGTQAAAGAATWCRGVYGQTNVVSAQNSLVGTTASDRVGTGATVLRTGGYVVQSPYWNDSRGAVTRCNGLTIDPAGPVSSANSLVGTTSNDGVGNGGVYPLPNGSFVVSSPYWNNLAGAVTWVDGYANAPGPVTIGNSLTGYSFDQIGWNITVLPNGNYVVSSPYYSGGGAVTWRNSFGGGNTQVSSQNSLVGTGWASIVPLVNGNYVVVSPDWANTGANQAGAVTLCSGTSGRAGALSSATSLVGTSTSDRVGSGGITVLTNGNFVVRSPSWSSGIGAVTWVSILSGLVGSVSSANSLVGGRAGDGIGSGSVIALANGSYAVASPYWSYGTTGYVGAVTRCSGSIGRSGLVSAANSLIGSQPLDRVGSAGVCALSNGNYVVSSPFWRNDSVTNAGAATWVNGASGLVGKVSSANSLVGSQQNDQVGAGGATALANGNYVVSSPAWANDYVANAGAATWCSGGNGRSGTISSENSLIGTTANDRVGGYFDYQFISVPPYGELQVIPRSGIFAFPDGHYVTMSPTWNGSYPGVGAITWGDGLTGTTGNISIENSLTGGSAWDRIGSYPYYYTYQSNGLRSITIPRPAVTNFAGGACAFISLLWQNAGLANAGAVTFCIGPSNLAGEISEADSVLRGIQNAQPTAPVLAYDLLRERLVVGRPAENIVSLIAYRVPQKITFASITAQTYPRLLTLNASSSSGLPVSFNVLSGPANLTAPAQLSLNGTGTVAVAALQAGDETFISAVRVTNTFTVKAAVTTNFATPIWWLMQYGYTNNFEEAVSQDLDSDGAANWQEYVAGTSPTNAGSRFAVDSGLRRVSFVTLSWQSVTNRLYVVEKCTNLSGVPIFVPIASNIQGKLTTTSYNDATGFGLVRSFYRVRVQ